MRFVVGTVLLVASFASCSTTPPPPAATAPGGRSDAAQPAFVSAVKGPPQGWSGPTFKLSAAYPETPPPPCPKEVCTWLTLGGPSLFNGDFSTPPPTWNTGVWKDYIQRVLNYVKEGQDPQLANDAGFESEVGGKTRWFHVPWMAYDDTAGREFENVGQLSCL